MRTLNRAFSLVDRDSSSKNHLHMKLFLTALLPECPSFRLHYVISASA